MVDLVTDSLKGPKMSFTNVVQKTMRVVILDFKQILFKDYPDLIHFSMNHQSYNPGFFLPLLERTMSGLLLRIFNYFSFQKDISAVVLFFFKQISTEM